MPSGGQPGRRVVDERLSPRDVPTLDALGVVFDSSLSSRERDLLVSWEKQICSRATPDLKILQIGVGNGGSVRTWAAWFPSARVIGLDVRRISLRSLPPNVEIVTGDQTDAMVMGSLCRCNQFDLVIDDGSEDAGHKLHTFLTLFPWLAGDGLYLCVNPDTQDGFGKVGSLQEIDTLPATSLGTWFGQLGSALVSGVRPASPVHTPLQMVLRRTQSVTCLPGSVVVQARP